MPATAENRPARSLPALLLGTGSESWGDERERSVMLEAYAYAFILSVALFCSVIAVVAWFVPAWVTILLFIALVVPSTEWARYCRARDVDPLVLTWGGRWSARTVIGSLLAGGCGASIGLAVYLDLVPDTSSGLASGIVGSVGGLLAVIWLNRRTAKRKRTQAESDED